MEEKKIDKEVEKVTECDCEALKLELEQTKKTLQAYIEAYKELTNKYNRLYAILDNQIEFTLNLK